MGSDHDKVPPDFNGDQRATSQDTFGSDPCNGPRGHSSRQNGVAGGRLRWLLITMVSLVLK